MITWSAPDRVTCPDADIVGVGIDLVAHDAVLTSWTRWERRWLGRWCAEAEMARLPPVRHHPRFVAAIALQIAVKEAVAKVLIPPYDAPWPWTHIQVSRPTARSRPTDWGVSLLGEPARRASELGVARWAIDATSCGGVTLAWACGVRHGERQGRLSPGDDGGEFAREHTSASSVGARTVDDGVDGAQHDVEVTGGRPIVHVMQVEP